MWRLKIISQVDKQLISNKQFRKRIYYWHISIYIIQANYLINYCVTPTEIDKQFLEISEVIKCSDERIQDHAVMFDAQREGSDTS